MIDEKKLKEHFAWIAMNDDWCWDFPDATVTGFFDIVGDDRKGLEKILSGMDSESLWQISGLFTDISEKWPDRKMTKFLEELSLKIIKAGYRP